MTATCPDAENKEEVFAISGGFEVSTSPNVVDFFVRASEATNNFRGWQVTFVNTNAAVQGAITMVVCAYFKTK